MKAGKQEYLGRALVRMMATSLWGKCARLLFAPLAFSILIIVACSSTDDKCEGSEPRVCLVPFEDVSGDLVGKLVDYYQDQYHLEIRVLDNESLPMELVDTDRNQVGGIALIEHMGSLYPEAFADQNAVLIGMTPLDMYIEDVDWRFAFWVSNTKTNKAMVSSARMNPKSFGLERDDDLLYTRVRKVVTHLIGTLHFGLPQSDDPRSVLYNNVLSLDDLDRMGEDLPIAVGE